MIKRIITAVVCLAIFLPVLYFSGTDAGRIIFPVLLMLLAVIGLYELFGCVGLRRKKSVTLPTYLFAILLMTVVIFFPNEKWTFTASVALCALYMFYVLSRSLISCGNIRIGQVCEMIAVSFYIALGFLCIIKMRYTEFSDVVCSGKAVLGKYLFLLIFLGAWTTDTGAYFVGVFLGKHKLIPQVSPNKTVEGAFGGVIGCIVGYAVYGAVLSLFFDVSVNWLWLMLLAVIISVVDQFGDLIFSYIKREHGIKDYGNLFPGHGGVLDRFDSIISIAPFVYFITVLAPIQRFTV